MKKNHLLAYVAATLFAIAAVISFIEGVTYRGIISVIGTISFVLAGIHYQRSSRKKNL